MEEKSMVKYMIIGLLAAVFSMMMMVMMQSLKDRDIQRDLFKSLVYVERVQDSLKDLEKERAESEYLRLNVEELTNRISTLQEVVVSQNTKIDRLEKRIVLLEGGEKK